MFVFACCTIAPLLEFGALPASPMDPSNPTNPSRPWIEIVAEKLQADDAKIPSQWKLSQDVLDDAKSRKRIAGDFIEGRLDEEIRSITSMDATALVVAMTSGSLTAAGVVTAFCKRAAYAHQLVCRPLSPLHPAISRFILLTRCRGSRATSC